MKVQVNSLIFDDKLLGLRPINLYVISRYRQAARSGAQFPPPIIEKGTLRVISGNHRVTMYREEFGDDHEIEVVERVFPDEAAVIRLFAEENSKHGNPLSGISQKAITQSLLKYGDTPETVAQVLNIPVKKVKMLGDLTVWVVGNGKKKQLQPIKHGLEHIIGQTVKKDNYDVHRQSDRGLQAKTLAAQLIRWLECGWIDRDDPQTVATMKLLYDALAAFVGEEVAA